MRNSDLHRVKNNIYLAFILTSFDFMTIGHSLLNLWNLLFYALALYASYNR